MNFDKESKSDFFFFWGGGGGGGGGGGEGGGTPSREIVFIAYNLTYSHKGEVQQSQSLRCCYVPILLTRFSPEPQRNVSIAAVREAVHPSNGTISPLSQNEYI